MGHSWAQLGHKVTWGIKLLGAQLGRDWGTVEAKPVGVQLRHTRGTVGAQSQERREKSKLGHTWGNRKIGDLRTMHAPGRVIKPRREY